MNKALSVIAVCVTTALCACLPAAASAATFSVNTFGGDSDTNTADNLCDFDAGTAGEQCTLVAAIEQSNATGGADVINFDRSGAGLGPTPTITIGADLPAITQAVTIAAGNCGTASAPEPCVGLSGAVAADGFVANANGVSISGLAITGYNGAAGDRLVDRHHGPRRPQHVARPRSRRRRGWQRGRRAARGIEREGRRAPRRRPQRVREQHRGRGADLQGRRQRDPRQLLRHRRDRQSGREWQHREHRRRGRPDRQRGRDPRRERDRRQGHRGRGRHPGLRRRLQPGRQRERRQRHRPRRRGGRHPCCRSDRDRRQPRRDQPRGHGREPERVLGHQPRRRSRRCRRGPDPRDRNYIGGNGSIGLECRRRGDGSATTSSGSTSPATRRSRMSSAQPCWAATRRTRSCSPTTESRDPAPASGSPSTARTRS